MHSPSCAPTVMRHLQGHGCAGTLKSCSYWYPHGVPHSCPWGLLIELTQVVHNTADDDADAGESLLVVRVRRRLRELGQGGHHIIAIIITINTIHRHHHHVIISVRRRQSARGETLERSAQCLPRACQTDAGAAGFV